MLQISICSIYIIALQIVSINRKIPYLDNFIFSSFYINKNILFLSTSLSKTYLRKSMLFWILANIQIPFFTKLDELFMSSYKIKRWVIFHPWNNWFFLTGFNGLFILFISLQLSLFGFAQIFIKFINAQKWAFILQRFSLDLIHLQKWILCRLLFNYFLYLPLIFPDSKIVLTLNLTGTHSVNCMTLV